MDYFGLRGKYRERMYLLDTAHGIRKACAKTPHTANQEIKKISKEC